MSHPDPLYDYEDFDMDHDSNYDDFNDFYPEEIDGEELENSWNDSMDGDHDSAMTSAGWGTDEDYGYYGDPEDNNDYGYDDREDFHSDEAVGYVDYNEDGPYDD